MSVYVSSKPELMGQTKELIYQVNSNISEEDISLLSQLLSSSFIDGWLKEEEKIKVIESVFGFRNSNITSLRDKTMIIDFYKFINENQFSPLSLWMSRQRKKHRCNFYVPYEVIEYFTFGLSIYSNTILFKKWHLNQMQILNKKINKMTL